MKFYGGLYDETKKEIKKSKKQEEQKIQIHVMSVRVPPSSSIHEFVRGIIFDPPPLAQFTIPSHSQGSQSKCNLEKRERKEEKKLKRQKISR